MNRLFTIILAFIPLFLYGQFPSINEHYVLNPFLINPSYAGSKDALNVATYIHRQWTGVKGTPETLTLAADAPFLREEMGLGLILANDRIGVTNKTQISANYAYKVYLNEG